MADFDSPGTKTPEPILMKLVMVDCVQDSTPHDNYGGGSALWVVSANMRLANLSFSHFFVFFSSRALVAFLDQSGRSKRQNACFRPRMCLLGVATISDYV